MKRLASIASTLALVIMTGASTFARTSKPAITPTSVTGKIDITYNTRTKLDDKGKPQKGVTDLYVLDINVTDTMIMQGKIEHLPTIFSANLGSEDQSATLTYNLDMLLRDPASGRTGRAGKLTGGVPIDANGIYRYGDGNLRMAIDAKGRASKIEENFQGLSAGKAPVNDSKWAKAKEKVKKAEKWITKGNKKILVTKYDEMDYVDLKVPAGPAGQYPNTIVRGKTIYDYEREAWYFENVVMSYNLDGKDYVDRISGSIKWTKSPNYVTSGEGQYDLDVLVNETPNNTEAAAMQPASSEADVFAVDPTKVALTGIAKYKDQLRGETVTASAVTLDLNGNNGMTKQQIVNLTKVIWLVNVVPMNSD